MVFNARGWLDPCQAHRGLRIAGGKARLEPFIPPKIQVAAPLGAMEVLHMGFLAWIVTGLIAGWLAGTVMKGGGYGILVDIILGILGGIVGGWLFGLIGVWPGGGMIGAIIVAFVGAVILVWITRLIKKA
jgi:uncharacterized membrane protein YeaQ/YmgE (transglycosylase-associated protein family)